ncbi:hypothetical protein HDU84_001770, partial [Entophlyctis sp. JEL0112]
AASVPTFELFGGTPTGAPQATTASVYTATTASSTAAETTAPSRIPSGCANPKNVAVVFRNLSSDILAGLQNRGIAATFFVTAGFATANVNLTLAAYSQGHTIGLAIEHAETLTVPVAATAIGPPTDRSVNSTALESLLSSELHRWDTAFGPSAPTPISVMLVAFTKTAFIDLFGAFMYPRVYASLENAVDALGFTPILVPFGEDYYSEESAAVEDVFLSNCFLPLVNSGVGFDANDAFLRKRGSSNLESIGKVLAAVDFLATINVAVVNMT